jgi:hypothetical protein
VNTADGLIRLLAGLSLAALALITGIVSYLHALAVVHATGSTGLVADLMILTASLALLDAIRNRARKPRLAMVSLAVGIGATVAMNIVAGLARGPGGALVASLPPVAFVLSLETLMGIVRLARGGQPGAVVEACPHGVASSAEEGVELTWLHGRDCLDDPPSQRHLAGAFGLSRARVAALVGNLNGQHPPEVPADEQ